MRAPEDARRTTVSTRWLYALGAVLILAGIGTALYQLWPDVSYRLGMIGPEYPYPCKIAPAEESRPAGNTLPKGTRLVIPDIGVDAQVFEGDSETALARGVYLHVETELPGEGGNSVIAGHRNRRAFALLGYLDPGDVVALYWNGTEHDYRVTRVFSVGPEDTEILEPTSSEQLTLYTCKPRFLGNKRTVVIAEPATE